MSTAGPRRKQIFNEINITPLTDIFLVLLIIMMVVAPMVDKGRPEIKPPTISNGSSIEPNKVIVEISADGKLYVQGQSVQPNESLTSVLKVKQAELDAKSGEAATGVEGEAAAPKNLIIRADKKTKSGQVIQLFSAARDAGFTKVTVSGESLSEARQSTLKRENSISEDY